jgi:hypothetical protein
MQELSRSRGEKIEIEGCALVRIARIEEDRIRLDVTAPFGMVWKGETTPDGEPSDAQAGGEPANFITLRSIESTGKAGEYRALVSLDLPTGVLARRAELINQNVPPRERFPWKRFRPTVRVWRRVGEAIGIALPSD